VGGREGCRACEVTPKAFDSSAQGCRACEATLGTGARQRSTLPRVSRRVRNAAPVILDEDRWPNRRSSSRTRVIIASPS